MKILSLTVALVMVISTAAMGSGETFKDGKQLQELCAATEDAQNHPDASTRIAAISMSSHCFGYVIGAYDSYVQTVHIEGLSSRICLPSPVTNYQVTPVVVQYLEAHPDQLQFSAAGLVLVALAEEYPCEEASAGADHEE